MTTMQQYFDYSQLSLTAYAENLRVGALSATPIDSLNKAGLVASQTTQLIADGWQVVDQSKDTLYGSSGFSATLFHNTQTNEYVFANRGTAGAQDLFVDGWGITTLGLASSQVIDMYRYYKQLITPAGQSVSYSSNELETLYQLGKYYAPLSYSGIAQIYNLTATDTGLGKISADQTFATTGHSLGGHLSLWLNALIPNNVDHVYTYNGAGQGNLLRSAISLINGVITGTPISITPDSDVTNLYGDGGPAIIAGVGGAVGQNIPINIEYKDPIGSLVNGLYNHSIVQLTDAIAVANLLSKLDSNITTTQYNQIFDKSSNVIGTSLESVLDGLRKYFGQSDTTPNDNRTQFYDNLHALQNSATFQALADKVTLVAPPTSADEARSDIGLFLSLYYLTPFALKTDGSIAADAQLTIANPDITTQFKDDKLLTPEQITNGEANFSDMYLADRAAMLSWKLKLNAEDFIDNNGFGYMKNIGTKSYHFEDITTNLTIDINKTSNTKRSVIFGESIGPINADTLTGSDNADHLYGMAGADTLNGGKGNDWLEGGADGDTLTGGAGIDYLYGGAGTDTYLHNTSDGNDVIIDSDGDGKIVINGSASPLSGGTQKDNATNLWQSADKLTQYALYHNGDGTDTLNIYLSNGERLFVKNWQNNQLGIKLEDAPAPTITPVTDQSDLYFASTADANINSGAGNDVLVSQTQEALTLNGGAGDDLILGYGNGFMKFGQLATADKSHYVSLNPSSWQSLNASWQIDHTKLPTDVVYHQNEDGTTTAYLTTNWKVTGTDPDYGTVSNSDFIYAFNSDGAQTLKGETLYGGTGNDLVAGSATADYIDGGDDNDILYGNAGDDNMFGGQGKDYAFGGDGSDNIDGGTEDDTLVGGYGADYLMGGAGDDELIADLPNLAGTDAPPSSTDFTLMGDDILDGGIGNDKLFGGAGDNTLFGGKGDDKLSGDALGTPAQYHGNDYLDGGEGIDTLWGYGGNDTLIGGDGNDHIEGDYSIDKLAGQYHGNDIIDGGAGNDTILGEGGNDTIFGGLGDDLITGDGGGVSAQYEGDDVIDGGAGNDTVYGDGGNDTLYGGAGQDQLHGDGGNDILDGGADNDVLKGGAGNDTLEGGSGHDSLYGEAGNDTLIGNGDGDYLAGGVGQDTYYAQVGDIIDDIDQDANTIKLGSANQSGDASGISMELVNVNIIDPNTQASQVQQAIAISNGAGTFHVMNGATSNAESVFDFGNGTQVAYHTLVGDTLQTQVNLQAEHGVALGGVKNDTLSAQANTNTYLSGGRGNDNLFGNTGNDTLMAGQGDDALAGREGSDTMEGGDGDDLLAGGEGDDVMLGNADHDTLYGQTGDDQLVGGSGNDTLYADAGNDTLIGGTGNDVLDGGAGADTYQFNLGDGNDTLSEQSDAISHIQFGAGITMNDISISYADPDKPDPSLGFTINYGTHTDATTGITSTDSIQFKQGLNNGITADFSFADGTTVTSIEDLLTLSNHTAQNLTGDVANNILIGSIQHDTLTGMAGDDGLIAGLGNDTLNGGQGNDILIGGAGNDSYQFNLGDGQDFILDNTLGNSITFGAGISLDSITTQQSNGQDGKDYLTLYYGNQGDSITIQNGSNNSVSSFIFSDTTLNATSTYGLNSIIANPLTLNGTVGNDTLTGGRNNDTLNGKTGDDTLIGGLGNDTYQINIGDGTDTIIESSNGQRNTNNTLQLGPQYGAGINLNDVTGTQRIDADGKEYLVLQYGSNPMDQVSILDGFKGAVQNYKIQKTETVVYPWGGGYTYTSPVTLTWQELIANTVITPLAVNGGDEADALIGGKSADTLTGGAGDDSLTANAGDDLLDGGLGNDTLIGGAGLDTYVFSRGTGNDVAIETNAETNHIVLGSDIALADVDAAQHGDDLIITIKNTTDSLTLQNYFSNKNPWLVSTADGVNNTTVADLLYTHNLNNALLTVETRIQNYQSDFLNALKLNEETIFNQANQNESIDNKVDNVFTVTTITQSSDAASIYGAAQNSFTSSTLQTGTRSYTAYTYTAAATSQVQSQFVSLDAAALLYGQNGGASLELPAGAQPVIVNDPYPETGGGSATQPSHIAGYMVPTGSSSTSSSYTMTAYTATSPVFTTYNNQQIVVEIINGGDSNNHIQESNGGYTNTESWWNMQSGVVYGFDGVRLLIEDGYTGTAPYQNYYKKVSLDAAHQVLNGGAGDDVLSGGGWSLDANGDDGWYIGGSFDFFSNMGNRSGNFLYGGSGNDTLIGTALADELIGGEGNDYLNGAAGADTYIVLAGANQGWDTINDSGYTPSQIADGVLYPIENTYGGKMPTDTVVFEAGIRRQDLQLSWGASPSVDGKHILNISWGEDSGIHVVVTPEQLSSADPYATVAGGVGIETFQFADGTTMTMAEMIAVIDQDIIGDVGDNTLIGGNGNDAIQGGTGNDHLVGDFVSTVIVRARASLAADVGASMELWVDGVKLDEVEVRSMTYMDYSFNIVLPTSHDAKIDIVYTNDAVVNGQDRNLFVASIQVNDTLLTSNANGVTLDKGTGAAAFDGQNVIAGQSTMAWNGALRFTVPADAASPFTLGGNDLLDGGAGNDTMSGGAGNDTYIVDSTGDAITEYSNEGLDTVQSNVTYTLGNNLENLTLTGTDNINGTGNVLNNLLTGNAADNILNGNAGLDILQGQSGNDSLFGGADSDLLYGGEGDNQLQADAQTSTITVRARASLAADVGANMELWIDGAKVGAIEVRSASYTDYNFNVVLPVGADTKLDVVFTNDAVVNGQDRNLFVESIKVNDYLMHSTDSNVSYDKGAGVGAFDGVNVIAGQATMAWNGALRFTLPVEALGANGNDLLIGGQGNDTITTGEGRDIVLFNAGDGQDIINASTGADNTLSLGGNFDYNDLSLTKTANDLTLKMGATDQITLKDWYSSSSNKSVINLQVIAEAIQGFSLGSEDSLRNNIVENFNFSDIVAQFDAEGNQANWQLTDARLTAHLQAGSDVAAIGGDLAYQYGKNSSLTGMGVLNAQSVISATNFGQTAQAMNDPAVWQAEVVKFG